MQRAGLRDRLFAIDTRSLAAFRICLGAVVAADLATRAGALEQHYTDAGVLPRAALTRLFLLSGWHWSIHSWTGSLAGQAALFTLAGVAAGALIVGYRSRLATIVTWLLLVSVQARNPMVLYGADQLLRLLLFWSMFLPLGAAWSLDRRRLDGAGAARPLSAASAALLLQPCVMYVFSGLLKLNPAWQSGAAIASALSADMYATPLGRELLRYPTLLASLSHVVPWIELLTPVALFVPWATTTFRAAGLLVLIAFHVGIACVLATGLFPLVALTGLLPFVPGTAWDRLRVLARRPEIEGAPGAPARQSARPRRPSAAAPWTSAGIQAVVAGLLVYTLVWNVAGLRVEEYTARESLTWYREWWAGGRAGVPLTFRDYSVERRLGAVGWIGRIAGLEQRWDMFARVGPEIRGWPLAIGTLRDGTRVSVLEGGRPLADPAHAPRGDALAFYPGARWLVYFTYLRSGNRPVRELLPAVVSRDWSRCHPGREIDTIKIVFVRPTAAPDGGARLHEDVWYEGPAAGS